MMYPLKVSPTLAVKLTAVPDLLNSSNIINSTYYKIILIQHTVPLLQTTSQQLSEIRLHMYSMVYKNKHKEIEMLLSKVMDELKSNYISSDKIACVF